MIVIMSVAIVNHGRFQGSLAITNLAYEIALSIRQAQVYGVSVRQFQTYTDKNYGVAFTSSDLAAYTVFADIDADGLADSGESVESARITGGNTISQFCGMNAAGAMTCGPASLSSLSVSFQRPNPDAIVSARTTAGSSVSYAGARIYVRTPAGDMRCVVVRSTGQVAVETACP